MLIMRPLTDGNVPTQLGTTLKHDTTVCGGDASFLLYYNLMLPRSGDNYRLLLVVTCYACRLGMRLMGLCGGMPIGQMMAW